MDQDQPLSDNNNPQQRVADKPLRKRVFYYIRRGGSTVWLIIITLTVLYALVGIQESRKYSVEQACLASNKAHDGAITELKRVTVQRLTGQIPPKDSTAAEVDKALNIALAKQDEETRKQTAASLASTILLIDVLAPKVEDCSARADEVVTGIF